MVLITIPGTPASSNTDAIRAALAEQFTDKPMAGPLHVEFEFFFVPPSGCTEAERAAMLAGEVFPKGPGFEELERLYSGAMDDAVWAQDALVASSMGRKTYREEAGVTVKVWQLEADAVDTAWDVGSDK